MRLMRFHPVLLLSLGLRLLRTAAASVRDDEAPLRQLNQDTFRSNTSQGLWSVAGRIVPVAHR